MIDVKKVNEMKEVKNDEKKVESKSAFASIVDNIHGSSIARDKSLNLKTVRTSKELTDEERKVIHGAAKAEGLEWLDFIDMSINTVERKQGESDLELFVARGQWFDLVKEIKLSCKVSKNASQDASMYRSLVEMFDRTQFIGLFFKHEVMKMKLSESEISAMDVYDLFVGSVYGGFISYVAVRPRYDSDKVSLDFVAKFHGKKIFK